MDHPSPSKQSDDSDRILYCSFNQDNTCLAVATQRGIQIYGLKPFKLLYEFSMGPLSIVEMNYQTNAIFLVGKGSNSQMSGNKLVIWDTMKNKAMAQLLFASKVMCIKINKDRLVVTTKQFAYIYDLEVSKLLKQLPLKNQMGRLALSATTYMHNYLAFSDSTENGLLQIYDLASSVEKVGEILAHQSPILKVAMNYQGTQVATCSCKGTMIRVFSLPKGEKLHTFSRGITNAMVYFLNFSRSSNHLIVSCDSGTIHVFPLEGNNGGIKMGAQTPRAAPSGMLKFLLPKQCDDFMAAKRSKVQLKFGELTKPNICAMNLSDD